MKGKNKAKNQAFGSAGNSRASKPRKFKTPKNIVEVTQDNFSALLYSKETMLLYFWGENCPPCLTLGPMYEKVARKFREVTFGKSNTTEDHAVATHMGIRAVPYLYVFREGIVMYEGRMITNEVRLAQLVHGAGKYNMDNVRADIARERMNAGIK